MAFENLLTYTEVDSAADLTVDSTSVVFDTMRRDAVSYVYKDFGVNYFAEFEIDFEVKIDSGDSQGSALVCAVSNTIGTHQDMISANDGIAVYAYINAGNLRFYLADYNTDDSDFYTDAGSSSSILYCTFSRVNDTNGEYGILDIYSDSGRTSHIDSLYIECETGDKRYLYVLASRDDGSSPADTITGYTQNFQVNRYSSSRSSSSKSSTSVSSSSSSHQSCPTNTKRASYVAHMVHWGTPWSDACSSPSASQPVGAGDADCQNLKDNLRWEMGRGFAQWDFSGDISPGETICSATLRARLGFDEFSLVKTDDGPTVYVVEGTQPDNALPTQSDYQSFERGAVFASLQRPDNTTDTFDLNIDGQGVAYIQSKIDSGDPIKFAFLIGSDWNNCGGNPPDDTLPPFEGGITGGESVDVTDSITYPLQLGG